MIYKSTRFLSLIFLVGGAHAQAQDAEGAGSSVTLYGLLDAGISYVSNQGRKQNVKFDDGIFTPNLLGFQGSEDLGNGLRAVFKLEDRFALGTGTIIPGQGLFGQNAYVGLASNRYGTLTLGNQLDFMDDALFFDHDDAAGMVGGLYNFRAGPFAKIAIPGNPQFAPQFNWDRLAVAPVGNAIKYQSARIAGFSFGALYGFGNIPGSLGSGDAVSFGANYSNGAFGAGAAYTEIKYVNASGPAVGIRNWGVGGHYQFGSLTTTVLVTTVRNTFNGGAIAQGEVGAAYLFAPDWQLGADYMYMKGDRFLDKNHAHQATGALQHFLSKRTLIYAEAVYQRTNEGAHALINGILDPNGSSSGPNQFIGRLGIQTRF